MKVILCVNPTYPEAIRFSGDVADYLLQRGHTIVSGTAEPAQWQGAELAIVIGGDGTMLRAVRQLRGLGIPFWGVNLGHLGYLAEVEPQEAPQALEALLDGAYTLERRATLAGEHGGQPLFALNDLSLHRGGYGHLMQLEVRIEGTEVYRFGGDGLLISSPTGSTAYNLSAGGPVLMPESRLMALTPVCAHAALCAPIVVPEGNEVEVRVLLPEPDGEELPVLSVDGCERYALQAGDIVRCRIGGEVSFARTGTSSFFAKLRQKLGKM